MNLFQKVLCDFSVKFSFVAHNNFNCTARKKCALFKSAKQMVLLLKMFDDVIPFSCFPDILYKNVIQKLRVEPDAKAP